MTVTDDPSRFQLAQGRCLHGGFAFATALSEFRDPKSSKLKLAAFPKSAPKRTVSVAAVGFRSIWHGFARVHGQKPPCMRLRRVSPFLKASVGEIVVKRHSTLFPVFLLVW